MSAEFYQDSLGDWRWRIVSSNGKIVAASSEGFVQRAGAVHNLELLAEFLRVWRESVVTR